jgi:hypothetical protein
LSKSDENLGTTDMWGRLLYPYPIWQDTVKCCDMHIVKYYEIVI